jgi:triphosphoribosyl-dephospho-CoA synthetase
MAQSFGQLFLTMNRTELMTKARASADRLLQEKGYISVVGVLLAMGRLSKENYERTASHGELWTKSARSAQ